MKKLLLFCLISFPFFSKSQDNTSVFPYKEGKIVYESIVDLPGYTKEELFVSAKKWIADNFKSANHVIQLEDKQEGRIIGVGNTSISTVKTWSAGIYIDVKMSLQVDCKEGRYRVRFYDIYKTNPSDTFSAEDITPMEQYDENKRKSKSKNNLKLWEDFTAKANSQFLSYISSFKSSVEASKKDTF